MERKNNISNRFDHNLISLSNEEGESNEVSPHNNDPISHHLNQILQNAIQKKSSDVHFEPYEKKYRIRLRCDGVLTEVRFPEHSLANRLTARIKVLANLDIAEKRLPQDGRFNHTLLSGDSIDIRVSTLPTLWGEKVVLRLLESQSVPLDINTLGFTTTQQKLFTSAINKPQGLILITGPTGSGKTVSLYTALNILNTPTRNISTTEDPVEINLSGINQVQINDKINLGFVVTLKALLRQDPDIIMVGEIRDIASAEMVTKAAQTGHLVLSTLHTNSACETVSRLINMGLNRYSITSCISLIVAQRLVRKLCPECKHLDVESSTKLGLELNADITIYKATLNGCGHCIDGYSGRIGIYEVLDMNRAIIEAIENQTNAFNLEQLALKHNFVSIKMAGTKKLIEGVTSMEELQRAMIY